MTTPNDFKSGWHDEPTPVPSSPVEPESTDEPSPEIRRPVPRSEKFARRKSSKPKVTTLERSKRKSDKKLRTDRARRHSGEYLGPDED